MFAEIQELGKKSPPEAFKRQSGSYAWPATDEQDIRDGILTIDRAAKSEILAVKRWLLISAERLRCRNLIPRDWREEIAEAMPHGLPRG